MEGEGDIVSMLIFENIIDMWLIVYMYIFTVLYLI